MTNRKELIQTFINQVKEQHFVPEFCHNLKQSKNKVYYSGPSFTDDELIEAIDSLLFGKWFSSGEKVFRFENEFSKTINQKHSVMVNSGSSANLVLVAALKKYFNWKDNDEILISVVGFPTTLNPLIQNNLKAVFVDIEFDTLNFDLKSSGLSVLYSGGVLLKTLANFQFDASLSSGVISQDYIDALDRLSEVYPDISSSIFAIVQKSQL
jgi:CDP-6-deoxy-D-xylo-4-hexulose-3-dehydrase